MKQEHLLVTAGIPALQSEDEVNAFWFAPTMTAGRLLFAAVTTACRRDLADPRAAERTVASIGARWGVREPGSFQPRLQNGLRLESHRLSCRPS